MKALRDLKAAAAKFGGTVEDDSAGHYITYQVCAPDGKWWVDAEYHIVVTTARGDKQTTKQWLSEAIEDAIGRIELGVRDAEEEE